MPVENELATHAYSAEYGGLAKTEFGAESAFSEGKPRPFHRARSWASPALVTVSSASTVSPTEKVRPSELQRAGSKTSFRNDGTGVTVSLQVEPGR